MGMKCLSPSSRAVPVTAAVLAGFSSLMCSRQTAVGYDGRAEGSNETAFAADAAQRSKRPLRSSNSTQAFKANTAGLFPF